MTTSPPTGRIAGIDYGTVRIGIAISDPGRTIAGPYENYNRRNSKLDAARFVQLVEEEDITLFVVGLPVHLDGGESRKSVEAREFGAWLTEMTGIPVEFFDERFTSVEAENLMLDAKMQGARMTRKRRKKRLDMIAAQVMLSAYLDSSSRSTDPGSIDG